MRIIDLDFYADKGSAIFLGYAGEHLSTVLNFHMPAELGNNDCIYVINFLKDGQSSEVVSHLAFKTRFDTNIVEYYIPSTIMGDDTSTGVFQLVTYGMTKTADDDDVVKYSILEKSTEFHYVIDKAITTDASDLPITLTDSEHITIKNLIEAINQLGDIQTKFNNLGTLVSNLEEATNVYEQKANKSDTNINNILNSELSDADKNKYLNLYRIKELARDLKNKAIKYTSTTTLNNCIEPGTIYRYVETNNDSPNGLTPGDYTVIPSYIAGTGNLTQYIFSTTGIIYYRCRTLENNKYVYTIKELLDKSGLQETRVMNKAPTVATTGKGGDIIEVDGVLYECFGQKNNEYIWKKVSFGGGAIFSGDTTVTPNITPEKQLENAIKAGDVTPGMLVSLLEDGKYKNYIIQTINTTTGACTKTQSGDYAQLSNKPTINNVELSGNKTLAELGINAGTVGFDETGTYADGSIGAGVSNQKNALNFTNQGALDYALNYDIDLFKFLKWTKGQYVDNSNGNIVNNSRFYISDPIEVSDLKGYLHLVITNSFTFKCAQYDANGDFLLGDSYGSAVDRVLNIQDTCKTIRFSVGAWSGTYTLSDYLNAITIYVKPAHNVVIEDYIGCEELDFLYDKYIVTPSESTANVSTTPVSFNQCVCLSTPCTKGQIFTITGTPRDNSGSRPVMFLDQANKCIYRSAETSAFNNVEITAPVTGTLVVNFLKAYPFQCYTGFKNLSEKIFKNLDSVNTIKSFPVDIIPDWLTNAMAIRTVGPLQKGYICLTCDDGATELESYTIPMLLNKQVPCTFGLWASTSKVGAEHPFNKSPVLQTPSGIAAVKNAITAGCSVAQHGPHEWTDMTNEFLNEFFDREAAAWEALEIDVKGAICPSHCINNAVRVTAGGRFGVVRSGYRGYLSKADQQAVINGDVFAEYNYYCAGPRSNVFGLSSFNTNAVTLSWMKSAVDYAIAQKMILVVYWHDWDLTAEQKSDLEAFIDYAKAQNITFCTLGEIPFLA